MCTACAIKARTQWICSAAAGGYLPAMYNCYRPYKLHWTGRDLQRCNAQIDNLIKREIQLQTEQKYT